MRSRKVFISYSHDSPQHQNNILDLSNRLRQDGIDCYIDQYEVNPDQGWPKWMEQKIKEADFVLVVCTKTYLRRFNGEEESGKGLGTRWESMITRHYINEMGSSNSKFIPICFNEEDCNFIPEILKDVRRYCLADDSQYVTIFRRFFDLGPTDIPPLGEIKERFNLMPFEPMPRQPDFSFASRDRVHYPSGKQNLPPRAIRHLQSTISNLPSEPPVTGRNKIINDVKQALRQRIVFLLGPVGVGKSTIALKVAHDCYKDSESSRKHEKSENCFDAFIWIFAGGKVLKLSDFLDRIAKELNYEYILHLELKEKRGELKKILNEIKTLIVIDALEGIDLDRGVKGYLEKLPETCCIIITTDRLLSISAFQIDVPPLEEEEAKLLVRTELDSLPENLKRHIKGRFDEICRVTGRIPISIKWLFGQFKEKGNCQEVLSNYVGSKSVNDFFQASWRRLSGLSKHVLMILTIFF